jgi:hypothetical protein
MLTLLSILLVLYMAYAIRWYVKSIRESPKDTESIIKSIQKFSPSKLEDIAKNSIDWKEFYINQLRAFIAYPKNIDFDKLFELIEFAQKSSQIKCHQMNMLLLVIKKDFKECAEYFNKASESFHTQFGEPFYDQIHNNNIWNIFNQIMLNEKVDIHKTYAHLILKEAYYTIREHPYESINFKSTEVMKRYWDDFVALVGKRVNENKDYFFKHFPFTKHYEGNQHPNLKCNDGYNGGENSRCYWIEENKTIGNKYKLKHYFSDIVVFLPNMIISDLKELLYRSGWYIENYGLQKYTHYFGDIDPKWGNDDEIYQLIDRLGVSKKERDNFINQIVSLSKTKYRVIHNYGGGGRDSNHREWVELLIELGEQAENEIREKNGIPRKGEGWVSETELYNILKNHFVDYKIEQHARPRWLKPQHLDIFFPDNNVAVEYQGKQHSEPVEFFGGDDAFKETVKRDKKKKTLCKKNKCELIYVLPDYDIDTVIKSIDNAIEKDMQ